MTTDTKQVAALALLMAAATEEAQRRGLVKIAPKKFGPQTDTELLDAVEHLTGHRIPRKTVCEEHGHEAPAQTFCDLYFGRTLDVVWIGNRGGGKTANSGELHGAKCRWNPGYKSSIAGAMSRQSYRAYAEFKAFTRNLANEIVDSLMSKTTWVNESETEVLGATVAQLNGPHPHLAQLDEADMVHPEPFEEFLNMAQGDEKYPAQQLLSSTRKKPNGLVQKLFVACQEATAAGNDPPWDVRIFCIFETLKPVHNCRAAPEEERKQRLVEKGMDPCSLCDCDKAVQGKWSDGPMKGKDRTFESVCRGRAFKSDGFVHLSDAVKRFRQMSRMVWEAQQECLTPNSEGLVHKWFSDERVLTEWIPYPDFGPIRRTWDWGGQNPNVCNFVQQLVVDVGIDADGKQIRGDNDDTEVALVLSAGTHVHFDEIYATSDDLPGEGDTADLATVVADRMVAWKRGGVTMKIVQDFCDPAGYIAKKTVRKQIRKLIQEQPKKYGFLEVPEFTSVPAPVADTVQDHIAAGEAGKIYVVAGMCENTITEYVSYSWPDEKKERNKSEVPLKYDDHSMDAFRYYLWNLKKIEERRERTGTPAGDPSQTAVARGDVEAPTSPLIRNGSAQRQNIGGSVGISRPRTSVFR